MSAKNGSGRDAFVADFMLIGAQKSGTTSLAAHLADHPQVNFSKVKEPGYFNETADWRPGLDRYHQLYSPTNGQICGEASTMYTFLPEYPATHERLHAYNPHLRLIYIMRDPVRRALSHYSHNLVRNLEKRQPEVALFADPRYINRGRYAVQIKPYIELFGRENILLLVFEEYIADQPAALEKVAEFLSIAPDAFDVTETQAKHQTVGVPYLKSPTVEKVVATDLFQGMRRFVPTVVRQTVRHQFFSNKLDELPAFSTELRQMIWRFVAGDVAEVESLLGRPLEGWRNSNAN